MMAMKTSALLTLVCLGAALAGCGETNVVRDVAQGTGLAGRPSEPADFVRASRATAPSGFMPVGVDAPQRVARRKTPAEFRAMEATLEAERQQLEAQAVQVRQAGATPPARPPVVPPQ